MTTQQIPPGSAAANGFWAQVLQYLGAPVNSYTLSFFNNWYPYEEGSGNWNPFGSDYHGNGQTNYASASAGAQATAADMQRIMPNIVSALKSGQYPTGNAAVSDLSHWERGFNASIGGYGAGVISKGPSGAQEVGGYGQQTIGNARLNTAAQSLTSSGGCKSLADSVSGGIPLLSGVAGFFGWIAQPCVYARLLIDAGCVLLILFGLHYVGGRTAQPANIILSRIPLAARAV